jgi:hypothetical protein
MGIAVYKPFITNRFANLSSEIALLPEPSKLIKNPRGLPRGIEDFSLKIFAYAGEHILRAASFPPFGGVLHPFYKKNNRSRLRAVMDMSIRNLFFCGVALVLTGLFFSCTAKPAVIQPPPKPVETPVVPPVPEHILGRGLVTQEALAAFLLKNNAGVKPDYAQELAGYYIREAEEEGVNHDVAFVQMCLETGYLRFGNLVTPDMNNFCGLGAIDAARPGERFPDTQTGVRAHIQHLKGYATEAPLKQELVDPRYRWVKKGSAPTIRGLTGKWAADPGYDVKIGGILTRLYDFAALLGDGWVTSRPAHSGEYTFFPS